VLGVLRKKDYWHLLPGIIEFVFFSILFIYPEELARPFYQNILLPNKVLVLVVLIPIYSLTYLVTSIILLKKYKPTVKNFYSSYEESRLNWIYLTNSISIFLYMLDSAACLIIIKKGYELNIQMAMTIAIAFIVYWISIYGINQKNLLLEIENDQKVVIENPSVEEKDIAPQNDIKIEEYEEKYNKIISFVNESKIYKDKNLNLFTFANRLQMPHREVSNVINKFANKNFNLFLNEFRIDEAKHLINNDSSDKFNLTWIAEEVGFNSRSTFFAAFKTISGTTPDKYKKSQRL
jgi:AraC-like DNA-binding protein